VSAYYGVKKLVVLVPPRLAMSSYTNPENFVPSPPKPEEPLLQNLTYMPVIAALENRISHGRHALGCGIESGGTKCTCGFGHAFERYA
jgi:hypothetical protein